MKLFSVIWNVLTQSGEVLDPCIKRCGIDLEVRLCLGCARRPEEIAQWNQLTVKRRRKILRELPERKINYQIISSVLTNNKS